MGRNAKASHHVGGKSRCFIHTSICAHRRVENFTSQSERRSIAMHVLVKYILYFEFDQGSEMTFRLIKKKGMSLESIPQNGALALISTQHRHRHRHRHRHIHIISPRPPAPARLADHDCFSLSACSSQQTPCQPKQIEQGQAQGACPMTSSARPIIINHAMPCLRL